MTEGTSSSAFILDAKGVIRTQPLGRHILPGVTRRADAEACGDARGGARGAAVQRRRGTRAREAFMTAASAFVLPIVEIDGVAIGDGRPGPVAARFRALYIEEALKSSVGATAEA